MKVLYLSEWYPTPKDQMAGLFVQKHAHAVAELGSDVCVLYAESGNGWYRRLRTGWKEVKEKWGLPDVVQVNVLTKNAFLAYWLWKRYGIPYIIVEHWSGYLPANYSFKKGVHGWLMHKFGKHAKCILPVSHILMDSMKNCGIENQRWQIIHNVVDDFFYEPGLEVRKSGEKIRLLHVSCFDEKAKNIKGLLRAVRKVAEQRQDFTLTLVGTGVDWAEDKAYADSLCLPADMLTWTGELTPPEVCKQMQNSDAFVMFSRYENAPVVLSECLAVGLPIVSSCAGGIPEMVSEDCGILVPIEDETALSNAILKMLDHYQEYNKEVMRKLGEQYSFVSVGKTLVDIYRGLL